MNTSRACGRAAPIAFLLTFALTACAPAAPPEPSGPPGGPTSGPSPSAPQPSPQPPALTALDPTLVGEWGVDDWLDSTGSHTLSATYRFTADGLYDYTFGECRSSTDCSILSQEQGYVQSDDGVLALYPQTASDDGARAWPYEVGYLNPDIPASLELHLLNQDGSLQQIFYGDG